MTQLRPYQEHAVAEVAARIAEGHRRILLVAPTGAGKGTMAAHLIEAARAQGQRSLFLAHRRELLRQLHDRVPWAGLIAPGAAPRPGAPCQVASVQTLARREKPPAELVIPDEAHHLPSESWSKVIAAYPDATVIGLTATPIRLDRRGLGDHFTALVEAAKPSELFAAGYLSPYEAFAFDAPQLHQVRVRGGDFHAGDMAQMLATNTALLVGNPVREYLQIARGRRALFFAVNIEHSLRLRDELRAAGVTAEHVDGETPEAERTAALEAFAAGHVEVLTNVALFTEGLDVPAAEVCSMCRPTMSEGMALQIYGRVLRPSPGKVALILDHAGNLFRHGLPDEDRTWSLEKTPPRVVSVHTCPFCRKVFGRLGDDGSCPKCGEIIAPPREVREENERRRKEQIEGVIRNKEEIKRRRAEANKNASEWTRLSYFLQLKKTARERNYKPNWVGVRFKERYKYWPHFSAADIERIKRERVEEAEAAERAHIVEQGCTCFTGCAPCSYCTRDIEDESAA